MKSLRLLFSLFLLGILSNSPVIAQVTGVDRILTLVNDDIILKSELEQEISGIAKRLKSQGAKLPSIGVLAQQVLEKMSTERLQSQAATRAGIVIDEITTDRALQSIAKRNKLTLSEFRKALTMQGVNYRSFRENLKREIALEKLKIKKIENKINITESEVQHLAQQLAVDNADTTRQYRLGHILVPLPEAPAPQQIQAAKRKVDNLLQKLNSGADFKQTATESSAGALALEGGVLEWRTRAELPTLFASQLDTLKKSPFVGPLRSASGFHLLALLESREQPQTHLVTLTHARHILIKNSELVSEQEIKPRLGIIRERALSGESFEELARSNSEDGSAKDGGDLGWQNPEDLVPEFVREMDKLKPGELSPIFKSRFGWHIIQMVERKQEDNTETYQLNQARQMIRKRKISEATETWLRRLRDDAYIEYRLDDL